MKRSARTCICTAVAVAGVIVLGAPASSALGEGFTLDLSVPSTVFIGRPVIAHGTGTVPPRDAEFSYWFSLDAIPAAVLSTCPADRWEAAQIAQSTGGGILILSQREVRDPAGNFSIPFGFTPLRPGSVLLCAYTDDGAATTLARASQTITVQGGGAGGKPANTRTPRVSRSHATLVCSSGSWSNRPSRYSYRWLVDGKRKKGASGRKLGVTRAVRGHKVQCAVTASNGMGSITATSPALRVR
jgi:hypothetical protein